MISLTNSAALVGALNDPDLDPELRTLIGRRAGQLYIQENRTLGQGVNIVVVEGGDTPEVINEALGFPITGEDAEEPSYEWIEDHGRWFEVAYARDGDRHTFIFVENTPATELGVHYLCLSHFWPDGEGDGQ